jgi:hypothetical protein
MDCTHAGWHCSALILETHYAVTRAVKHPTDDVMVPEFIRWSTPEDPPFPCLCKCEPCCDWRRTREEIDGPVVLPTS